MPQPEGKAHDPEQLRAELPALKEDIDANTKGRPRATKATRATP